MYKPNLFDKDVESRIWIDLVSLGRFDIISYLSDVERGIFYDENFRSTGEELLDRTIIEYLRRRGVTATIDIKKFFVIDEQTSLRQQKRILK